MDPARAPPALAAALTSPPAVAAAAQYPPVDAYEPRPWAALTQVAPPVAPPPMQAPSVVPPGPPPVNAPHVAPSPMAAPITQPPPPHHHYPPPPPTGTSYSDWHRTATQHSPPVHHMNGGPGSHAHDQRYATFATSTSTCRAERPGAVSPWIPPPNTPAHTPSHTPLTTQSHQWRTSAESRRRPLFFGGTPGKSIAIFDTSWQPACSKRWFADEPGIKYVERQPTAAE
ncbi:hypothetical protein PG990_004721 [Apiospora arundinis]